ncbi:sensor histidine kinase [Kitasatospora azatica]|uniref:sensor histidine kinase n=1 Tax=Kitasatospora azatica TaxID=58347 RepID=UPI000567B4B2|nr:histidine kinase [Kitasatospora azatica]
MQWVVGALAGRRARVRWVHLVLGGALLMPFWLLATVLLGVGFGGQANNNRLIALLIQLLALPLALPMAWIVALLPVARVLVSTAARALAGTSGGELARSPATSWAARRRTSHWFALHLLLGGVVSGMSLAVPPMVVTLWLASLGVGGPGGDVLRKLFGAHPPGGLLLGLPLGLALLALLLTASAGAGALLAHCAPLLLGPTPAERLAAAERRTLELAQRNRLARELHDSVGHALSAVTLQAAAARRVLRRDPDFAEQALEAIEEVARAAVAELDAVLGVLREDADQPGAPTGATGPTLAALGLLIRQLGLAGVPVRTDAGPGLAELPEPLSREAYRIVQEGLTNVLRHAGPVPATLRLDLTEGRLDMELTNPIGADRLSRPGGGRGLRGVAERAAALHGGCESGRTADGTSWRLAVWLPVGTP